MEIAPAVTTCGESETGSWEIIARKAHPALRPYVSAYTGYSEFSPVEMRRLQVPHDAVVLIISLGPVLRVLDARNPATFTTEHRSFVAGLHDGPVVTAYTGASAGIQANITPLGAHLLLDVSMDTITNRVVAFDDFTGLGFPRFLDQLMDTPGWEARFDLLESFLARRLADAPQTPWSAHAWRSLAASPGAIDIDSLVRELNVTHKQLIANFRREIGLTPKRAARVLRFDRAVAQLTSSSVALADVAFSCGYYDQAHFNREFREFSGKTPTDYLASRLPVGVHADD